MQMALFDKVYDQGCMKLQTMDGYERTHFMNDIYNDYKMCKDLRQKNGGFLS